MKKIEIDRMKIVKFIKERYIYILAYLYLFSSVFIFFIGNLKYYISIPLGILSIIALIKAILNTPKMQVNLFSNRKKIVIIFLLIIVWVISSGIGGFIWQNRWDHKFRNALFEDLISHNWPVIENGKALCYYLGFWLPSAVIGKIFGIASGYLFQTIWAIVGVFISFGIICQYLGKIKIRNIIIFIIYSGVDIIVYVLYYKCFYHLSVRQALINVMNGVNMENVIGMFKSSSNTTLLFWVYNQTIPFWVGMMLLLQQKNSKSIVFIYSLMLLYSPFPLVALAPIIFYLIFKGENNVEENILKNILNKIKNACTFENIISILIIIVIGLFLKSNIAAGKLGIVPINIITILRYICYICAEYMVFLIFIHKDNCNDAILNILIFITFILPFIRIGNGVDFAMRTCIPLSFYIMLLVMKKLQEKQSSKKIKIALIIILCVGSITPMTEIIRTVKGEIRVIQGIESAKSNTLGTVFDEKKNECYENFIADTNSIFYKYLAK